MENLRIHSLIPSLITETISFHQFSKLIQMGAHHRKLTSALSDLSTAQNFFHIHQKNGFLCAEEIESGTQLSATAWRAFVVLYGGPFTVKSRTRLCSLEKVTGSSTTADGFVAVPIVAGSTNRAERRRLSMVEHGCHRNRECVEEGEWRGNSHCAQRLRCLAK
jgi:hypothetical protein